MKESSYSSSVIDREIVTEGAVGSHIQPHTYAASNDALDCPGDWLNQVLPLLRQEQPINIQGNLGREYVLELYVVVLNAQQVSGGPDDCIGVTTG